MRTGAWLFVVVASSSTIGCPGSEGPCDEDRFECGTQCCASGSFCVKDTMCAVDVGGTWTGGVYAPPSSPNTPLESWTMQLTQATDDNVVAGSLSCALLGGGTGGPLTVNGSTQATGLSLSINCGGGGTVTSSVSTLGYSFDGVWRRQGDCPCFSGPDGTWNDMHWSGSKL